MIFARVPWCRKTDFVLHGVLEQFGWFWGAKINAQIRFQSLFFRCHFRKRFDIEIWSIFGGSKPEKQQFSLGKTMIFTKSAFSIKIRKTMNFRQILGGKSEENSNKNRLKNALFFSIAFSTIFLGFWLHFGSQKSLKITNFRKN